MLNQRFRRNAVAPVKYSINTIASFCIQWCRAYPHIGNFKQSIDLFDEGKTNEYYNSLYKGMAKILTFPWAGKILKESYSAVIIDEYQDCLLLQQSIFQEMNNYIKVWVLGDPLQGIFGWAGELVSWQKMPFEEFKIDTYPWRWEKTNKKLGQYLKNKCRKKIQALLTTHSEKLELANEDGVLRLWLYEQNKNYQKIVQECLMSAKKKYQSVLVISSSYNPNEQCNIAKMATPVFQMDDPLASKELINVVHEIDETRGCKRMLCVINFLSKCSTYVNSNLESYILNLEKNNTNFSRITKFAILKPFITKAVELDNLNVLSEFMSAFYSARNINSTRNFRIYRKYLFFKLKRVLDYAIDNSISCKEALVQINGKDSLDFKSKYDFLISRPVLCKGLEAECVVIVKPDEFTPKDLYVAMTRATKMIYIILNSNFKNKATSKQPLYYISLK